MCCKALYTAQSASCTPACHGLVNPGTHPLSCRLSCWAALHPIPQLTSQASASGTAGPPAPEPPSRAALAAGPLCRPAPRELALPWHSSATCVGTEGTIPLCCQTRGINRGVSFYPPVHACCSAGMQSAAVHSVHEEWGAGQAKPSSELHLLQSSGPWLAHTRPHTTTTWPNILLHKRRARRVHSSSQHTA